MFHFKDRVSGICPSCSKTQQDVKYLNFGLCSDGILSFNVKVSCHRSCRASYSSAHNYKPMASEQEPAKDQCTSKRLTRETGFDIRTQCFICSQKATKGEGLEPIIDTRKASGPNRPGRVLKSCAHQLAAVFINIFTVHCSKPQSLPA